MAQTRQKDILGKLADAGEGALSRVAGSQATARVLETLNGMRDRIDELQKRVTGLDDLERRVAKLEKALADAGKPKKTPTTARKRSTSGTTSRSTTRKKPSSS